VNFSARTISLTGGPDGIELVDPADRKHSWLWQEAVIVGQEASMTTNRDRPVPVQGVRNAIAISTGGDGFSAALLGDGTG
jgi:hypothetical protein